MAQHIQSFGGSKDKITLAGNGFGGVLALLIAGSSLEGGTIQGVISQSASLTSPWAYTFNPHEDFDEIVARIGCGLETHAESVECLRNKNPFELTTAASNVMLPFPFGIYLKPKIAKSVSSRNEFDLLQYTVNNKVLSDIQQQLLVIDMLIGFNGGDGHQFTLQAYPDLRILHSRRPLTKNFIENAIKSDIYAENLDAQRDPEVNDLLIQSYVPWGSTDNGNEIRRATVDYHTDEGFLIPIYEEITNRMDVTNGGNTYFYVYQVGTNVFSARRWLTAGADFGEEISILFGKDSGNASLDALGQTMREYWGNFVKRG